MAVAFAPSNGDRPKAAIGPISATGGTSVPHGSAIVSEARVAGTDRTAMFAEGVEKALAEVNPDELSPREALELLYGLRRRLKTGRSAP
mgnify:CR=1 FL=1